MKIIDSLSKDAVISDLASTTKEGVLDELAEIIVHAYPDQDKAEITHVLLEREKLGSTGIENGVAIPHAKLEKLEHIIIAVGRSKKGIDFNAHDGKPSHLFFAMLAPTSSAGLHLKTIAKLSRLLNDDRIRESLLSAKDSNEIYQIIKTEDENIQC